MKDIHQTVTQQIIDAMKNANEFEMPWHRQIQLPMNAVTSKSYHGINTVSLWVAASSKQYSSNQWATYKQWQSMGGQVNKGENGSSIIIYKPLETDEDEQPRVLIRSATVFNAEQVSNIEITSNQMEPVDKTTQIESVDQYVSNTKAEIETGGDKAYYSTSLDKIVMPERQRFYGSSTSDPTEAYYSTLLHELTHWTGHDKRCARDLSSRFGSNGYAMEELIAELGAAFLCAELNITQSPRQDHANYINHWIDVLEHDQKAIFWASARASEAATYLNAQQPK